MQQLGSGGRQHDLTFDLKEKSIVAAGYISEWTPLPVLDQFVAGIESWILHIASP